MLFVPGGYSFVSAPETGLLCPYAEAGQHREGQQASKVAQLGLLGFVPAL